MARHLTVRTGTRAVVTLDGLVVAVLDAGRHRLPGRASRRAVEVVDVREDLLLITSQEAAAVEPAPVGLAPAVVDGQLLVPRYRGVDAVDLATGTAGSAADTDVLSASATAVVARHAQRVTVLAPG